jgi:hypothetical protein
MSWAIYVDVAIGMALAITLLVISFIAGREPARHRAVWIVGVVLLGLRALFSSAVGVGTWVSSGDTWAFALGAAALVLVVPAAIIRPRWAGIGLLVSAVLQPLLLVILEPFAGAGDDFPVGVMVGFYSFTVAVIGGILIASTLSRASESEDGASTVTVEPVERVSGS